MPTFFNERKKLDSSFVKNSTIIFPVLIQLSTAIFLFYAIFQLYMERVELDSKLQTLDSVEFLVSDSPVLANGKFAFIENKSIKWMHKTDFKSIEIFYKILETPYLWIKINTENIQFKDEYSFLLRHGGGDFQMYSSKGELIFQKGNFKENEPATTMFSIDFSIIPIPEKFKSDYLYVRVRHEPYSLVGPDKSKKYYGSLLQILKISFLKSLPFLIPNLFFLLLGILIFLLYIFSSSYRYNIILYYSTTLVLFGISGLTANDIPRLIFDAPLFWFHLSRFSMALMGISLLLGFRETLPEAEKKKASIYIYILFFISLVFDITISNLEGNSYIILLFLLVNILFFSQSFITFFIPIIFSYKLFRKGDKIALFNFWGFLLPIPVYIYETIYCFIQKSIYPPEIHWGFLFPVFAQAFLLGKFIDDQREKIKSYESLIQEMKIKEFQNKMNPHFLFNTLNLIHSLTETNPIKAGDSTILLSNMYRYLHENNDKTLVTIEEEILFSEEYLSLMQFRFSKKFSYSIQVDPSLKEVMIPPLSIQPILENSFKHGFPKSEDNKWSCELVVERIEEGLVRIAVKDNGTGSKDVSEKNYLNRSLGNTLDRFQYFYPSSNLKLENADHSKGMVTEIVFQEVHWEKASNGTRSLVPNGL